ncbi:reverse transcriptase [Phytophthora megakarya]|uniref:Reverse transcriptase n=1 Tax=Phytophthora megakarya TaxID=4795 RepID=A0A225UYA1_9STRA|nr:reverse transcriptase [Phytophthora megakarya]
MTPDLILLRQRALDRLRTWTDHELLYDKRYWNGSADSLASAALQRQCGIEVESEKEIQDLVTLNRLDEILVVKIEDEVAQISAVMTRSKARSGVRLGSDPNSLREEVRIQQAQDEDLWISGLKKYLVGEIRDLTREDAKMFESIAMNYKVDQSDLLFYCPTTKEFAADRDKLMRLAVPETLQQDILHHYRTSLQGGHQGIGRTYDRIRDLSTGEGCIRRTAAKDEGELPGNLQATYPFQMIAMDHIPSLHRSFNGNTELLIFVDLFSGYVITKASASRSAQTIAETYEECVFRRFGASEVIRHDREPGFMSDFFKSFNKILGRRQRATMANQIQANGSADRMIQTTTRALKMYIYSGSGDPGGEHSQARSRSEKVAISDAKILSTGSRTSEPTFTRSNYGSSRQAHNTLVRPHPVEAGSRVWLYVEWAREGYAKKLAHLWHGPFRVAEKIGEYAARLEIAGSAYSIFPVVHVSKVKPVRIFPDRPIARLEESDADRVNFDEALLPEDSWIQDPDQYEVDRISDMITGKRTRYGRIYRDVLVHWREYEDPTWVDEADLNCGALLYEFL